MEENSSSFSSEAESLSPNACRIMDEVFRETFPDESFHETEKFKSVKKKLSFPSVELEQNIASLDIEFEDGTIIYGAEKPIGISLSEQTNLALEEPQLEPDQEQAELAQINEEAEIMPVVQEHQLQTPSSPENVDILPKQNTRKRTRNPDLWKQNIRKKKRESGEQYVDIKGRTHEEKSIRYGCRTANCKFKCSKKINEETRQKIHQSFWKLSDSKKSQFYNECIVKSTTTRKRTKNKSSKKSFSFYYYFKIRDSMVRVCKFFFLGTLDISSQRIYYYFKKVHCDNNIPRSPLKGKNRKKIIPETKKDEVRNHIRSFNVVESHYCRASTNKAYLQTDLNLSKMYKLYCLDVNEPVKFYLYNKIFNTEFNIAFHVPKKDMCDKCVEFRGKANPTEEEKQEFKEHEVRKERGKSERDVDRKNLEPGTAVLTFDLENVFPLPKSNVSSYFYKQKMNCYNLTAHCNKNKIVYCSVWNEGFCGRAGIHISNALIKILNQVVSDIPDLTKLILWSDSCVPQNKNSIMSFAIQAFLQSPNSKNIQTIEQKFSEPGHGNLQEIDSAHSVIERHIRNIDIFSPLGLLKTLLAIPKGKLTFKILQMSARDYFNYDSEEKKKLQYEQIPYTKVKHLLYEKNEMFKISYKNCFDDDFDVVQLNAEKKMQVRNRKRPHTSTLLAFPAPVLLGPKAFNNGLTENKKEALFSMLNTMPKEDQDFYMTTVLKNFNKKKNGGPKATTKKSRETTKTNERLQKCKKKKN